MEEFSWRVHLFTKQKKGEFLDDVSSLSSIIKFFVMKLFLFTKKTDIKYVLLNDVVFPLFKKQ